LNTETTKATSLTLPALIRLEDGVTIVEAPAGLPAPANERFVDFTAIEYEAAEIREGTVAVVKPAADPQVWVEDHALPLKGWLDSVNGAPPTKEVESLPGFIYATSDALRVIQFMHNYAIPAALYGFPGIQD
jgi:hypothetical protein